MLVTAIVHERHILTEIFNIAQLMLNAQTAVNKNKFK